MKGTPKRNASASAIAISTPIFAASLGAPPSTRLSSTRLNLIYTTPSHAQLYKIIKFFDGKDASELQAEFKELDADGSGELDVDEVTALVQKVFGGDVSAEVVQACFEQMDEDKSGEVDFDEFCSFFGVKNE